MKLITAALLISGVLATAGVPLGAAAVSSTRVEKPSCSQPQYPPESEAAGEAGSVILSILITPEGKPAKVEVKTSSGFPRLDAAAVASASQCQFKPGTKDGAPIESTGEIKFTFKRSVPLDQSLEGVIQTVHLNRHIDAFTGQCRSLLPDDAEKIDAARTAWHTRNDPIVPGVIEYMKRYAARIAMRTSEQSAVDWVRTVSASLQVEADQSVSRALSNFEKLPAAGRLSYCSSYLESVTSGKLDLENITIKFPDLQSLIRPSP